MKIKNIPLKKFIQGKRVYFFIQNIRRLRGPSSIHNLKPLTKAE